MIAKEQDITDLLVGAAPAVRAIALQARTLVRGILPDATEIVDRPAKLIGYGRDRTYKGLICGIALHREWVNLMFARGTDLPDPSSLLEGTGKRARHVRMRTSDDVDRPEVRALLLAAAALAPPS